MKKETQKEVLPQYLKEETFNSYKLFKESPFYFDHNCDHWVSQGKPVLWIKEYDKNGVIAYSDVGYGRLKLIVNGIERITYGGNCLINGDYVTLSGYYGEENEGNVFKKLPGGINENKKGN